MQFEKHIKNKVTNHFCVTIFIVFFLFEFTVLVKRFLWIQQFACTWISHKHVIAIETETIQ